MKQPEGTKTYKNGESDPVKSALMAISADSAMLYKIIENNKKVIDEDIFELRQEIAILRDEFRELKKKLNELLLLQEMEVKRK